MMNISKVNIGDAKIALIGIITMGRHPDIYLWRSEQSNIRT